ncbi:MAG: sel1 repeat family protein [Solimicrobium sp.]|nr:sel1 repeat family protein [Solimicrobium sp.]
MDHITFDAQQASKPISYQNKGFDNVSLPDHVQRGEKAAEEVMEIIGAHHYSQCLTPAENFSKAILNNLLDQNKEYVIDGLIFFEPKGMCEGVVSWSNEPHDSFFLEIPANITAKNCEVRCGTVRIYKGDISASGRWAKAEAWSKDAVANANAESSIAVAWNGATANANGESSKAEANGDGSVANAIGDYSYAIAGGGATMAFGKTRYTKVGTTSAKSLAMSFNQSEAEKGNLDAMYEFGNSLFALPPNSFINCMRDGTVVSICTVSEGLRYLEMASKKGHKDASYRLGQIYRDGLKVKQSNAKTDQYFALAHEQHHQDAALALADSYLTRSKWTKDLRLMMHWTVIACNETQNPRAPYVLGMAYLQAEQKSSSHAIYWLEQSSLLGYVYASCQLGRLYLDGTQVEQDTNKAINYFERAISQGNTEHAFTLGNRYLNGDGVEKNIEKAIDLYRIASTAGNITATILLGRIYAKKNTSNKDVEKAIEYLTSSEDFFIDFPEEAYLAGNLCLQMAEYYYQKSIDWNQNLQLPDNGNRMRFHGNTRNVKQVSAEEIRRYTDIASKSPNSLNAINLMNTYFTNAIFQFEHLPNHPEANYKLGMMYANGEILQRDSTLAFKYLSAAHEANHWDAAYQIGFLFLFENDLKANLETALFWFQKADEMGRKEAKGNVADTAFFLGELYDFGEMNFPVDKKKSAEMFELASRYGHKKVILEKLMADLGDDNTLTPVRLDVNRHTLRTTPKIESQPCPGDYKFVKIHAGSTAWQKAPRAEVEISDTTTIAVREGMFVATVVSGVKDEPLSKNFRIYSGLITATALNTVNYAIQQLGLTGAKLNKYFFETIKLLDTDERFTGEPGDRGVTFGGVVLYFDSKGKQKKFIYGLGGTAVVAITNRGAETHHLQGDFEPRSELDDAELTRSALGPRYSRVIAANITAIDSYVEPGLVGIQLMTEGCALAFFDPSSETKGTADRPSTLHCKDLPKHGKFNPQILFNLANKRLFDELYSSTQTLGENLILWTQKNITPTLTVMGESDFSKYCELATVNGRALYADRFSEVNPMPAIEEVLRCKQKHIDYSTELRHLIKRLDQTFGDDVLHLSIDTRAAFDHLKSVGNQRA